MRTFRRLAVAATIAGMLALTGAASAAAAQPVAPAGHSAPVRTTFGTTLFKGGMLIDTAATLLRI